MYEFKINKLYFINLTIFLKSFFFRYKSILENLRNGFKNYLKNTLDLS